MLDDQERVSVVREVAHRFVPRVARLAERVCLVPAPTYAEGKRAAFVAAELRRRGLSPRLDEIGNVIARRPGTGGPRAVMLAAHMDTVFPLDTPLAVERANGRLTGPGIGDNSLGVAALIELPELLDEAGIQTAGDLLLVFNVGEEGLGNLRGMRAATERYAPELAAVLAVEGHNLGRVTHVAVGSRRIRVRVSGPGGHSWGAFGNPSAIHELARIVARIADLEAPADPKTTFNVGLIDGGTSVNTIAPCASAVIDLRSTDVATLSDLAERVERIVMSRATGPIRAEIEVLGERPAGATPASSPIVRTAIKVLSTLGIQAELNASSTDANVPIAMGIPAICVGLTHGGGSHRVDEWIEIEPIGDGLAQLALLLAELPLE